MNIAPTIEHYQYDGTIYYTDFRGEREALERSDFLQQLMPPAGRKYFKPCMYRYADSHKGCSSVTSSYLKAGGLRVRIWWEREGSRNDKNPLPRDEIISLSRQILNEAMGRPAALADWPFPIGGIAA